MCAAGAWEAWLKVRVPHNTALRNDERDTVALQEKPFFSRPVYGPLSCRMLHTGMPTLLYLRCTVPAARCSTLRPATHSAP